MKKLEYWVSVMMLLMTLGSCADESVVNSYDEPVKVMSDVAQSRTAFVDDGSVVHVNWNQNDAIGLSCGELCNVRYEAQTAGSATTFKASGEALKDMDGKTVVAYYPYQEGNDSLIKVVQPGIIGDFNKVGSDLLFAEGKVENNVLNLHFKHIYPILKIKLPEYVKPADVTLKVSCDDQPVPGSSGLFNIVKGNFSMAQGKYAITGTIQSQTVYVSIYPMTPSHKGWHKDLQIEVLAKGSAQLVLKKMESLPEGGFVPGKVYEVDFTSYAVAENQKEILMDLYKNTDGDHWTHRDNWGSDKPLGEWYGITTNCYGAVTGINLNNNNLKGTLPASVCTLATLSGFQLQGNALTGSIPAELAQVMDRVDTKTFTLRGNRFTGKLPDAVAKHTRFDLLWPLILKQNGEGVDWSGVTVPGPEFSVKTTDGAVVNSAELYKANKYTAIVEWATWSSGTMSFMPDLKWLYKAYHPKGLEVLGYDIMYYNDGDTEEMMQNYMKQVRMEWPNFAQTGENCIPAFYWGVFGAPAITVVDQEGKVVFNPVEKGYADLEQFLADHLGKVDKTDLGYYTSTDFSKDGEITCMQKATEGRGIDLVFMGDAFVDKDMNAGGLYEKTMKEAVEEYFSIEPFKSFRNWFNIYMVKVVSVNAEIGKYADNALHGDDDRCFDYAKMIPSVNPELLLVNVIYSHDTGKRSYTNMYTDGSYVAYMMEGVNEVLIHEAGGHGFGQLLDEYVESGYETLTLPDVNKDNSEMSQYYLDQVWENMGMGANVDYRNDAKTVKWAHFMANDDYKNEIGIYEGAYLYGYGAFRPSENSMMRYNDMWFNAPSREQIYKAIRTRGESGYKYDLKDFLEYDRKNLNQSRVPMMRYGRTPEEMARRHQRPRLIRK